MDEDSPFGRALPQVFLGLGLGVVGSFMMFGAVLTSGAAAFLYIPCLLWGCYYVPFQALRSDPSLPIVIGLAAPLGFLAMGVFDLTMWDSTEPIVRLQFALAAAAFLPGLAGALVGRRRGDR